MMARVTIAWLPHLLLSIQPERMTVSRKDKYHNNTTVDQHGTNSIRNQQMRDLPVPPLHPDASKGPEAVMQAIDEWFDYQDRLKALGITTHPMDRKNQPEPHIASPLSLQQRVNTAKVLKKMPTTHETLEAKLQRASGPLFSLTAQLLPPENSNGPAHSHLTPNAASQYQYPSQQTDTRSPSQLVTSRELATILTRLLNVAWDMWQEGIQQADIEDSTALPAPQYPASRTSVIKTPSHQIGRRWIAAFLRQRQNTAWDHWRYCNGIQFHTRQSPIKTENGGPNVTCTGPISRTSCFVTRNQVILVPPKSPWAIRIDQKLKESR